MGASCWSYALVLVLGCLGALGTLGHVYLIGPFHTESRVFPALVFLNALAFEYVSLPAHYNYVVVTMRLVMWDHVAKHTR